MQEWADKFQVLWQIRKKVYTNMKSKRSGKWNETNKSIRIQIFARINADENDMTL